MTGSAHQPLIHLRRSKSDFTWIEDAACRNHPHPDVFFSDGRKATHAITRHAITICKTCDVQTQCFLEAFADPELYGIWGGTTARQRTELRKRT